MCLSSPWCELLDTGLGVSLFPCTMPGTSRCSMQVCWSKERREEGGGGQGRGGERQRRGRRAEGWEKNESFSKEKEEVHWGLNKGYQQTVFLWLSAAGHPLFIEGGGCAKSTLTRRGWPKSNKEHFTPLAIRKRTQVLQPEKTVGWVDPEVSVWDADLEETSSVV